MRLEVNNNNAGLIIRALSNEYRTRILSLCKDISIPKSSLAKMLNISASTISVHLQLLEQAQLIVVTVDRKNKMKKYVRTLYDEIAFKVLPVAELNPLE